MQHLTERKEFLLERKAQGCRLQHLHTYRILNPDWLCPIGKHARLYFPHRLPCLKEATKQHSSTLQQRLQL